MFHRIPIANDGSDGASKALAVAIKIAEAHQAELHMLCVEEMPYFPTTIDEVVEEKAKENHRVSKIVARAGALAAHAAITLPPQPRLSGMGMKSPKTAVPG